jgi:hypothetical protein
MSQRVAASMFDAARRRRICRRVCRRDQGWMVVCQRFERNGEWRRSMVACFSLEFCGIGAEVW